MREAKITVIPRNLATIKWQCHNGMRMLKIARLEKTDLDACAKIVSATELFRAYGYSGESARKHLEAAMTGSDDDLVVAREGAETVGFAWFVKKGAFARSGYLRLIAVDPARLKSGAGRALMTELERRHLSPDGLVLLVTSTNRGARAFYEKLGYRQVGELPDYVKPGLNETIYFRAAPGGAGT